MLRMAVFVEGGMGLLAIGLGYLFGYQPLAMIHVELERWPDALGLAAIVPMFLGFLLIGKLNLEPLRLLRSKLDQVILPLFRGLYLSDLFWLSILAGVGEELLFRGFFHLWISDWLGLPAAVILTAVLFGLVHWVTPIYALIAGLMGLLLSASLVYTDNLLVAILVHGLYDFLALWYYLRYVHKAGPAHG
ncbi:MAG: CPBP family intramembrane metalloprotease [Spirochaetaceae bacterium]|nr:CPBP family intramembrane metalloprotease [Spirochaetaceae bacterium]|tara:strand:- start:18039 stop:18608 length:570 start_codon:yes stop_codon:yes gene_type:complete